MDGAILFLGDQLLPGNEKTCFSSLSGLSRSPGLRSSDLSSSPFLSLGEFPLASSLINQETWTGGTALSCLDPRGGRSYFFCFQSCLQEEDSNSCPRRMHSKTMIFPFSCTVGTHPPLYHYQWFNFTYDLGILSLLFNWLVILWFPHFSTMEKQWLSPESQGDNLRGPHLVPTLWAEIMGC